PHDALPIFQVSSGPSIVSGPSRQIRSGPSMDLEEVRAKKRAREGKEMTQGRRQRRKVVLSKKKEETMAKVEQFKVQVPPVRAYAAPRPQSRFVRPKKRIEEKGIATRLYEEARSPKDAMEQVPFYIA